MAEPPHVLDRLPPTNSPLAWALAACVIALAVAAKPILDHLTDAPLPPLITLYPTAVLAGALGGARIGVAAALVTTGLAWALFMEPASGGMGRYSDESALMLSIYCALSLFLGWSIGRARVALDTARANEARRLAAATESVHRIKNLLTVVQALATRSRREAQTVEELETTLRARLAALDAAQAVLLQREWHAAPLDDIVCSAMAPFLPSPRIRIAGGPAVTVPARFVSGLCLALYELATNALKYGALSDKTDDASTAAAGAVSIEWTVRDGAVILTRRETVASLEPAGAPTQLAMARSHRKPLNAPREQSPCRSGFGAQLIASALSHTPGSHVRYGMTDSGVLAQFEWRNAAAAA